MSWINAITIATLIVSNCARFSSCNNPQLLDGDIERIQNKPIGVGLPQLKIDEIYEFPIGINFLKNYVLPQKPVVIRNGAKSSPAFSKWTDKYFLSLDIPHYETLKVERAKKEIRHLGMLSMHFHEFLKKYNNSDIYMVERVPEYLKRDLIVPCSLRCPGIVYNKILMWFSSGGTKSVLHNDDSDNLNCLYRGKKEFLIIHRKYRDYIEWIPGGYCPVDVDSVDYKKYYGLSKIEYYNVSLSAGDCLFIPYLFPHQVRSFDSNVAINMWWHHWSVTGDLSKLCDDTCKKLWSMTELKPIGKLNYRSIKIEDFRKLLGTIVRKNNNTSISVIIDRLFKSPAILLLLQTDISKVNYINQTLFEALQCLDSDQNNHIIESEIKMISADCSLITIPLLDIIGRAINSNENINTADSNKYTPDKSNIKQKEEL